MPYRRLPKTDIARIKTLKTVADLENKYSFHNIPLSYNLLNKAKRQLSLFEHHQSIYIDNCKKRQNNNIKFREAYDKIKTYISHFIPVYNMAVERGEFKKDGKNYYNLSPDTSTLPDLNSEDNLLLWGQNLIEGERQRVSQGGAPMTNPTIASLRIHYELFKDARAELQFLKIAIQDKRENLNIERANTDQLIKEIWDEIESNFSQLPPKEKREECEKCGVIYYNRSSENDSKISAEEYAEMNEYEKEEEESFKESDLLSIKELPFG